MKWACFSDRALTDESPHSSCLAAIAWTRKGDRHQRGKQPLDAIPIVGAAFALVWAGAMYVSHRAQTLREQRFGESLRDQLRRRIAQLDYEATRAVRVASVLVTQLPPMVCATAFLLASWRIDDKSFRDVGIFSSR